LIYDSPEVTSIPLEVRAGWIRELYPHVEVIEARGGPSTIGDTPEIRKMHENYILGVLRDRKITHFYSSEFYGDHVSRALGALDCRFDSDRSRYPVSGSAVRSDPFRWREFLSPCVYRSHCTWVLFLGAPSTGKTSISQACAEYYHTVWMPEYGREYWEKNQVNRRLKAGQLVEIARGHREREGILGTEANRYFFIDTDARTTRLFASYYHGSVLRELEELANSARGRYDVVFLCDDDIPNDDTWDRSGEVKRSEFQNSVRDDLIAQGIEFAILQGNLSERWRKFGGHLIPEPVRYHALNTLEPGCDRPRRDFCHLTLRNLGLRAKKNKNNL